MKKENQFYNWIKKHSKNIYFDKIENSLSVGIADLLVIISGHIALIELKQINTNTLENYGLNKFQKAWHIKYNKHGGNAFILLLYQKQKALKLLRLGAVGFSHIITQPKSKDGLQKIWATIKNYKK